MSFRIYNSFESLGDPCAETATTSRRARKIKARMIEEISEMIAGNDFMSAPEELDEYGLPNRSGRTGYACEHSAWDAAHDAAGVGRRLTLDAARVVARAAVVIEES
jgi:hypothetical protein